MLFLLMLESLLAGANLGIGLYKHHTGSLIVGFAVLGVAIVTAVAYIAIDKQSRTR